MQINRLFEIIYLLLQRDTITSAELAERFEVSTRTIYRDVETLSAAGIPVYMKKGKGGGISLLPDFVLDKTVFTDEEKENLLSSLQAVGAVNLNERDTILQKLRSLFGESYVDWIEVDFSPWYNNKDETKLFQALKKSICNKTAVVFQYSNNKGEKSQREVEPLKLCFKGEAWYLFGYCKTRCENRFFKLRRIRNLESSNKNVEHEAPNRVLKEENFNEELIHLKLHVSGKMAYRVYEEFEKYYEMEDGSFIVEIDYPAGDWLFYYIATFGSYCEVLEPQMVRDDVKKKLNQMLTLYQ